MLRFATPKRDLALRHAKEWMRQRVEARARTACRRREEKPHDDRFATKEAFAFLRRACCRVTQRGTGRAHACGSSPGGSTGTRSTLEHAVYDMKAAGLVGDGPFAPRSPREDAHAGSEGAGRRVLQQSVSV